MNWTIKCRLWLSAAGLNETRLRELSMRQAMVMAEINATIARAKANFYKVLTPEQRAVVLVAIQI